MVATYGEVFDSSTSFKAMTGPPMKIHLKDMGDEIPTHCTNARPVPFAYRDEAKKELEYMDSMGLLEDSDEPVDWVAPFFVLPES